MSGRCYLHFVDVGSSAQSYTGNVLKNQIQTYVHMADVKTRTLLSYPSLTRINTTEVLFVQLFKK